MSKKMIGIIVGAALVAVLAVTLVLLNQIPPETPESTPATEIVYVLHAPEGHSLQSAAVHNAEDGYTILAEKPAEAGTPEYHLEGYEGYPISATLGTLARNLTTLTAKSLVSETGGDKAAFGLDKPAATVDVIYDDGTAVSLYVGNAAPGNEGHYVSASGSDAIYLVSSSLVNGTLNGALSFMDKTVSGGDPEATLITDVELGGTVRPAPIVLEPVDADSDAAAAMATHLITSPVRTTADTQTGLAAVRGAFAITAGAVVGVAENDVELAEYGLLEPYSTVTVGTDAESGVGTIRLKASAPDAEGNVNLMNDRSNLVYRVEAASLPWLDIQVFDMMSKLAILPHIDKVSAVRVETPDESYRFELSGEGSELVVMYEGEVLGVDQFRKLYQELIGARYVAEIGDDEAGDETAGDDTDADAAGDDVTGDDSAPPADDGSADGGADDAGAEGEDPGAAGGQIPADAPLLMTVTYEYRDGSTPDRVRFYAGPTRRAYIRLNDDQAYLTPRGYVDSVLPNIQRLLNGDEIEIYLY